MSRPNPPRRAIMRPLSRNAVTPPTAAPKWPQQSKTSVEKTGAPFGKIDLIDRAGEASWAPDWFKALFPDRLKALLPASGKGADRDFNAAHMFADWPDAEFDGTDQFRIVGAGSACPLPPRSKRVVRVIQMGDSQSASDFWHVSVSHALVGLVLRTMHSRYAWSIKCYGPYLVIANRDPAGKAGAFDLQFIPVCFAEGGGGLLAASLPKPMFGYYYSYEDIFYWIPEALRTLVSQANFVELRAGPPEPVRGFAVPGRERRVRIHVRDEHFGRAFAWLRANGVGDGWNERHGPLSVPVWRPEGISTESINLIFRAWWPAGRDVVRLIGRVEKGRAEGAALDKMQAKVRALVAVLNSRAKIEAAKAEIARRGHVG